MRVTVVMSTYQGAAFVRPQLESILSQLDDGDRVLVRDDGSTDGTPDAIHALGDPRIELWTETNVGFVASFLQLLQRVSPEADVVMLSDQDDIWLPGKVAKAKAALADSSGPTLYCSRLVLTNASLTPVGLTPAFPRGGSFVNALTENIATGCTCALNQPALALAKRTGTLEAIAFHDWWLYLVVAAFGRVITDNDSPIYYRQHGANAMGMGSGLQRYVTILRFLRRRSWVHIMFRQIENFRQEFGPELDGAQRQLLDRLFNPHRPLAAIRLALAPLRLRQTLLGDLLFRALVVFEGLVGRGLLPRANAHLETTAHRS